MLLWRQRPSRCAGRRFFRVRPAAAVVIATCAMLCASPTTMHAQVVEPDIEYQVKAAFLYNFAKFVTWPDGTFNSATEPLALCIIGNDPFGEPLHAALAGRKAWGRRISLKLLRAPSDDDTCHIAFVSAPDDSRMARLMQRFKGRTVLTVGDSEAFAANGGMVRLLLENQKIRFDVNLHTAGLVGINLNSQLLNLARRVRK